MKKIRNQFLIWRDFFSSRFWDLIICLHLQIEEVWYVDTERFILISKLTFLNQRQKTKSWKFVKLKTQNQFLIWRCFWEIVYKLIWHCKYYFILTGNSIHKIITNLLRQKKFEFELDFLVLSFLFSFISRFAPELSDLFWFNLRGKSIQKIKTNILSHHFTVKKVRIFRIQFWPLRKKVLEDLKKVIDNFENYLTPTGNKQETFFLSRFESLPDQVR